MIAPNSSRLSPDPKRREKEAEKNENSTLWRLTHLTESEPVLKASISNPAVITHISSEQNNPFLLPTAATPIYWMKQNDAIRTASPRRWERPSTVRFLNLTNPDDATSSDALAVIRSHVARTTHGRKQQSRRARLEIRQYRPVPSSKATDRLPQGALQAQTEGLDRRGVARQRQDREDARMIERRTWKPNPHTYLTCTRRNPFQTSVSIISDSENALVDHCKAPDLLHCCRGSFLFTPQTVGALIVRAHRHRLRSRPWLYQLYPFRD